MATGAIGFIIATLAAVLSCMAGNCCINRRVSFIDYYLKWKSLKLIDNI